MSAIRLKGRRIVGGCSEGYAIVTRSPISFFGGIDPKRGVIVDRSHELYGKKISGCVLVFPYGKGSTVGSYVLYALSKTGNAPAGILNVETEMIIAAGCALANIPLIDKFDVNPIDVIKSGDFVKILENGVVEVRRAR
jgi:predicted aconitase with swiveling domain